MKNSRGKLFVLSSPSGGGKTTIIKALRKTNPDIGYSVSATTRHPRKNEKDGIDYYFLDETSFKKRIEEKAFIEWAMVHGAYYGTLKSQIDDCVQQGRHILLDTDVQGGINLKTSRTDAVLIFLLPPSMQVLKERLLGRGPERIEDLEKRHGVAQKEMALAEEYDFVVINDEMEKTLDEIQGIIKYHGNGSN